MFPASCTQLIPPRGWPPAVIWERATGWTEVTDFDQAGHIVRVPPHPTTRCLRARKQMSSTKSHHNQAVHTGEALLPTRPLPRG